ncbi:nucleotide-binding universal stress UspA family protein [Labedella gwakjiensis]|uniref:Nucleotide-binding universal stress UspA family protein n=1 Tax=Labedella gwakjiensis TaxID=390269 RepID=A0A2P8GT64_9MICO|nr:universal stress protein [Labedella gwakjiensis]PSL37151.1 nucleotide-binding universal stress UspA family protein [Labedella gwakjiensis]RUQ81949.1 universal stress protein [Labedella gwakjiensis]
MTSHTHPDPVAAGGPLDARPIVVGIDSSSTAVAALREAAALGQALGRPVDALVAWDWPSIFVGGFFPPLEWSPEPAAHRVLDSAFDAAFGADRPEGVHGRVVHGQPAYVLTEASRNAAFIVVGRRGGGGFSGLTMGSVTSAVGAHSHCPVVIVPAD